LEQVIDGPLGDDLTTMNTRAGPYLYHMIGGTNSFFVMLSRQRRYSPDHADVGVSRSF
jgi:hypothetical protein